MPTTHCLNEVNLMLHYREEKSQPSVLAAVRYSSSWLGLLLLMHGFSFWYLTQRKLIRHC